MKHTKTILLSALLFSFIAAGAMYAVPAFSANRIIGNVKAISYRRTLFVPVAQKMLTFETPKQMCFLDPSVYTNQMLYNQIASEVAEQGDRVLLGVFMECLDLADPGSWSSMDGALPSLGVITWLNPAIGEQTPMELRDYLDMREASFVPYVTTHAEGLNADKKVHRTENTVSLGLSGEVGEQKPKMKSTAIIGTTSLHHIPIEVSFRYTGTEPPKLDELYPLMDKFMAQQVTLNSQ